MRKNFLILLAVVLFTTVSGFFATTGTAYAACRVDDPAGGYYAPVSVPVTVSIDSVSLSGNSLTVAVSGLPSFRIKPCLDTEVPSPVTISVNAGGIAASTLIGTPSADGYSATLTINVSALSPGIYPVSVTASSGGTTDSSDSSFSIPFNVRRNLPPGESGTAQFSQQIMGIGNSYSFSVTSGPASVSGDLYKSTNGGSWVVTTGWLSTDSSGDATKGPWTCGSPQDVSVYIKWPDGTKTNTASYTCLPNPTATLTSSLSRSNRSMSQPINISWSSTNASECNGSIDLGLGLGIGGISGNITIPAEQLSLNNTILDGTPYPGTNSPQSANISVSITCKNIVGNSVTNSASINIFYNDVAWVGLKEPSCGSVSSAQPLSSPEANQVSFSTEIDNKATNQRVKGPYSNQTLNKLDNRVWGWVEPMIYKVSNDASGNPIVTPPTGYTYCKNDGGSYTTSDSWPNTTPYTGNVNLYFAPVGGGAPGVPTNFGTVGECHQNYPTTQTQNLLGWNSVSGADSYNVYRDGVLLANTPNTWYIDIFSPARYNESHSYYVTAKNTSGESAKTNTLTSTTPASCTGDPPQPPVGNNPSYLINPTPQTVLVGNTVQFNGLYDPDGNNIRYGNFLVNSFASWGITTPLIATSLGSGQYRGVLSGGSANNITSSFRSINPTATLNVTNPSTPDFGISISPSVNYVVKPNTANYTVTVTPSNGFTGSVALSISGLHSGSSAQFSPASINITNSSAKDSNLALAVSSSAANEQYTFSVQGASINPALSHTDTADINISSGGSLSCSVSGNPNPARVSQTVSFSTTVSGSTNYGCKWDYGDGQKTYSYTPCDGSASNYAYGQTSPSQGFPVVVDVMDYSHGNITTNCTTSEVVSVTPPPGNRPAVNYYINSVGSNVWGGVTVGYLPGNPLGAPLSLSWQSNRFVPDGNCVTVLSNFGQGTVTGWISGISVPKTGTSSAYATAGDYSFGVRECTSPPGVGDNVSAHVILCDAANAGNPACQNLISCNLGVVPASLSGQAGVTNFGFQAQNVSGGNGNYAYNFHYGDGQSSGSQSSNQSNYIYPNQGSYTADVGITDGSGNSGGCSISPSVISVSPPPAPGCTFTASPTSILYGQSSTLSWSCTPTGTPRSCTIKDDSGGTVGSGSQSGSKSVKPTKDTTYTLSCTGNPAVSNSTASVSVGFIPVIREILPR